MQDRAPNEFTPKLVLMGEGQKRQHGGTAHAVVALDSMYIPVGQYGTTNKSEDSRLSQRRTDNVQLIMGRVLSPKLKGPQLKDISEFVEFSRFATKLIVFEEEVVVKTQLLFVKGGRMDLEKDVA